MNKDEIDINMRSRNQSIRLRVIFVLTEYTRVYFHLLFYNSFCFKDRWRGKCVNYFYNYYFFLKRNLEKKNNLL